MSIQSIKRKFLLHATYPASKHDIFMIASNKESRENVQWNNNIYQQLLEILVMETLLITYVLIVNCF